MREKLYKFMGFYDYFTHIQGRFGNMQIKGYFRGEWAGLYFVGEKESFQFLNMKKEGEHFTANILDAQFVLTPNPAAKKKEFSWFLYTGPRGERVEKINGKIVKYNYEDYIFKDQLE